MVKLIIFDYDGVIVNSFPNVHKVYQIICKKLGKECPNNLEQFRKIYGQKSSECYNQLKFSEEDKQKANVLFKEEIMKQEPVVFEGIIDVIKKLSEGYVLAVASSSYKDEVEQKLRKFGILDNFKYVLGRTEYVSEFNKIKLIEEIVEKEGLNNDSVLLIGDRNVDFIDGTKAGLKNILLVDYGWGYNLDEIPGYKKVARITKPRDIFGAVEKY